MKEDILRLAELILLIANELASSEDSQINYSTIRAVYQEARDISYRLHHEIGSVSHD